MIIEDTNKKGVLFNRDLKLILLVFSEETKFTTNDNNEIFYGELEDFESEYPDYEMIEEENELLNDQNL